MVSTHRYTISLVDNILNEDVLFDPLENYIDSTILFLYMKRNCKVFVFLFHSITPTYMQVSKYTFYLLPFARRRFYQNPLRFDTQKVFNNHKKERLKKYILSNRSQHFSGHAPLPTFYPSSSFSSFFQSLF